MRRLLAAAAASLALPAGAAAADRFASPGALGVGACLTEAEPCSFERAKDLAVAGDTVRLLGGTYVFGAALTLAPGVSVVGVPGPRPTLQVTSNDEDWNISVEDATLRHVDVVADSTTKSPFAVRLQRATVEDASIVGSGTVAAGVTVYEGPGIIRGVVVRFTNGGGYGITAINTTTIEHTTLLGEVALWTDGTGDTIDVRNSILQGSAQDLQWGTSVDKSTVNIVNSRLANESGFGGSAPPGTRTGNITALADLTDFGHQLADSPTIDAGTADGADPDGADLDGDARWLGTAPDMGADEFPGKPFVGTPQVTVGSVEATFDVPVNAGNETDVALRLGIGDSPLAPFATQNDRSPGFDLWAPAEQTTQPATTYRGRFTATDSAGSTESELFEFTTLPLPDTTLDGPATTQDPRPSFTFSAEPAPASFTCAVDGGTPEGCTSPWQVPAALAAGVHEIAVRATDQWGGVETAAAQRTVTIEAAPAMTQLPTGAVLPPVMQVRTLAPKAGKPVFRKGKVRIAVTNPNAVAAKVAGKLVAKGRTLAKGTKTLAGGAKGTLVLKVTKAGRKAAKRKPRGTVTVSIGAAKTTKKLR